MAEKIQLVEGSIYRITSLETKDKPLITKGVFKGYTMVGDVDALCIELDDTYSEFAGKLRIIPSHIVLAIDVIVPVEKVEEKEKFSSYLG